MKTTCCSQLHAEKGTMAEWSDTCCAAHLNKISIRGLAISMMSEGGWLRFTGCVYSSVRLQLSVALLGRSTMLCSGLACATATPGYT